MSANNQQLACVAQRLVRFIHALEVLAALYHHFTGESLIGAGQMARASSLVSRPRQRVIQAALQDLRLFVKPN